MKMLKTIRNMALKSNINTITLSGFEPPNDFGIANLKSLIAQGKLPQPIEQKEFCFAIYETPFKEIDSLNIWIRLYVYTIFLNSYFLENGCIDALDDIYLWRFVKDILSVKIDKKDAVEFLESLKIQTKADTLFLELAITILHSDPKRCNKLKNSNCEIESIYKDYPKRWLQLTDNIEIKRCLQELLNE